MSEAPPKDLWLALHFHRFPLEVFDAIEQPAVAAERHLVVCANAQAAALGVVAGMRLSGALGLAPGLGVYERKPLREAEALDRLACWAGSFSPHVSLAGPDELLIEIGGCLRLFGGLDVLCGLVRDGAVAQGFSVHMALAPTPRAAQWLARSGQEISCNDMADIRQHLQTLPVEAIGLSLAEQQTLASLGARHLQDLFALPASGLARRFGIRLPQQLAQALGEAPDLRSEFIFPEAFVQKLELPAKVEQAAMLLFAARRLLASLAGWLSVRASGVAECDLVLVHEDGIADTHLVLGFASATRELARMERVLRERLDRLELNAAVTDLRLEAAMPVHLPGNTLGLFAQASAQSLDPVIERLRARLGKHAVHAMEIKSDYRPECATRSVERSDAKETKPGSPRPLWLLPELQSLQERDGALHYGGVLQRIAGPERIESGWWDRGEVVEEQAAVGDVRRDYYVAVSVRGEWLWIFRDRQGWWLQGVFA
ncbi:DNA polymerase Y family protein [Uliginosibacterium sp. H3]|uniref:DNA polymerase Y family protein n=1 Tax=Uliginosibacterium silvisoli TaxID=3114758 RepID=A0ABU6K995_9RHOO|nr:DNA polymerase Y family protein [Uliginosibacterium sp. H3]